MPKILNIGLGFFKFEEIE